MYRKLTAALLFVFSAPSFADSFYRIVRYECDEANNFVAIHYIGAFNEEGATLVRNADENIILPSTLVEVDASGDRISKMNPIKKTCRIKDGVYTVEIGPDPGNMNIQGRCGARISAWVEIYKDSKLLVRSRFEGDCFNTQLPVITKVLWRAGAKEPEITNKSADDFYQ